MTGFLLPTDGSVLIVDDKTEDAMPLIELLSSKGIACTYYSGADDRLPERPIQKVRLAFFDIQLFGPSDATSYASNILRLIHRLISDTNGPYIIVLWTTFVEHEANQVELLLRRGLEDKKPLDIIRLDKSSYFKTVNDTAQCDSLLQEIEESLSSRFSFDDIDEIKRVVSNEIIPVSRRVSIDSAIERISQELSSKLQFAADSFQLFTHWESAINKASGTTVEQFSSLNDIDNYWSHNVKNIILRMARAHLGQNIGESDKDDILRSALKTMNGAFLDLVEHHYPDVAGFSERINFDKKNVHFVRKIGNVEYKIKWNCKTDKYQVYIENTLIPARSRGVDFKKVQAQGRTVGERAALSQLIESYQSIKPSINTRLLLDVKPSINVQPGNIYLKKVSVTRAKTLLRNYYKEKPVYDASGRCVLSNDQLKKFKFIELEASPICDYAQNKWIKYRLLPGLMVPEKYAVDAKGNSLIRSGDNVYSDIPVVKLEGENYKIIFDFRLLKSVDKSAHKSDGPIFRLRNELSASILSRLSSHASRIGITTLE